MARRTISSVDLLDVVEIFNEYLDVMSGVCDEEDAAIVRRVLAAMVHSMEDAGLR